MNTYHAEAGPSRSKKPFISAEHRPAHPDGKFRVVLVSTGSVASVKMPDIVGALSKMPEVEIQIVATKASLHFYNQARIDAAVGSTRMVGDDGKEMAVDGQALPGKSVKIWTDEDEWSDWSKIGDPILHIELRRWADLVVFAPCSADFLAKLAAGFSDNLALSMMRALPPSTPVILCPAMNTQMFEHPFTADHLRTVQEKLGYMISGPQGAGKLACGDEGAGKMTDWRDIVSMIENFGTMFIRNQSVPLEPQQGARNPPSLASSDPPSRTPSLPSTDPRTSFNTSPQTPAADQSEIGPFAMQDWRSLTDSHGGDGSMWSKRWWIA